MNLLSKKDLIHGMPANTIIRGLYNGRRVIKTPAHISNILPLTPILYETWRSKSISLLSGMSFSLLKESKLLVEWINPKAGELILDLGASTGFYARSIVKAQPAAYPIAVDYSAPMLKKAIKLTRKDRRELYFLQADAEALPITDETMDAIVCGGSLNEFHSASKAINEAYRVLKPGGRFFLMYLTKARSLTGKFSQFLARLGGISFHNREGWDLILNTAGFSEIKRKDLGVVTFQLLEK